MWKKVCIVRCTGYRKPKNIIHYNCLLQHTFVKEITQHCQFKVSIAEAFLFLHTYIFSKFFAIILSKLPSDFKSVKCPYITMHLHKWLLCSQNLKMLFATTWYLNRSPKREQFNKDRESKDLSIWVHAVLLNVPQNQCKYSCATNIFKGLIHLNH